jgi:hypothetical protein
MMDIVERQKTLEDESLGLGMKKYREALVERGEDSGIFYGGESQSNIILNFDDAWASQWDIFRIFWGRGLTGSISVIPAAIDGSGLTMTQLRVL